MSPSNISEEQLLSDHFILHIRNQNRCLQILQSQVAHSSFQAHVGNQEKAELQDPAGRWAGNLYSFKNKTKLSCISIY